MNLPEEGALSVRSVRMSKIRDFVVGYGLPPAPRTRHESVNDDIGTARPLIDAHLA
jgi:hypothetical protein